MTHIDPNALQLLALLQRGGAYGHFWTNTRKSTWWPTNTPGPTPPTWKNVYFGVHPVTQIPPVNRKGEVSAPAGVRSQIPFIAAINTLFGEVDDKDHDGDHAKCLAHVKSLDIPPSVIVDSGGGYHCYWLLSVPWVLTNDEEREQARKLQAAWVMLVDSDADSKDLARVLRLPGTFNHKYDPPRPVTVVRADFDLLYELDDLATLAAPFIESDLPTATPSTSTTVSTKRMDAYVLNALMAEVRLVQEAPDGDKHRQLLASASTLGELIAGKVLDQTLTFNLLADAIRGRAKDMKEAEQTILDGFSYGAARPRGVPEAPPHPAESYLPPIKKPKLAEPGSTSAPTTSSTDDADEPQAALCSDLANARRLVEQHGDDLRYVPEWGWLVWDGRRWALDATAEHERRAKKTAISIYQEAADAPDHLKAALARHAISSQSAGKIAAMISLAESELTVRALPDDFDNQSMLLTCANGSLDLRGGELLDHDRADLLTKATDIIYDKDAKAPLWLAFLDRIFKGNADLIAYVQRSIGYTLTGSTAGQCMFICHGTGANGKSVLIDVVRALLGDYARNADASTFMAQQQDRIRSDVARLAGARFVATVEIDEGRKLSEALIKQVSSGDRMTARFLNKYDFEFTPRFKLWMATNHKPVIRGTDYAIWRRIRLIPFTVTIPEAERDGNLTEKLLRELPGILAWAVQGCCDWQTSGLLEPAAVKAATSAYQSEMDVIGQFLEESTITSDRCQVACADLYAAYAKWAEVGGEKPVPQRLFGARMTERGIDRVRRWNGWVYIGIGLVDFSHSSPNSESPTSGGMIHDLNDLKNEVFSREEFTKKIPGKLDHLDHGSCSEDNPLVDYAVVAVDIGERLRAIPPPPMDVNVRLAVQRQREEAEAAVLAAQSYTDDEQEITL
jgi:putative DNA primase/helicase